MVSLLRADFFADKGGIKTNDRCNGPSTPRHYSDEQKVEAKDVTFWKRFMHPLPRLFGGLFAGLLVVH